MYKKLRKNLHCRLCDSKRLNKVITLGSSPPGNALYDYIDSNKSTHYPLETDLCEECGHLQLSHTVDPAELFEKDYSYLSGTSIVFYEYLKKYSQKICDEFKNKKDFSVLDIGSNDGTCLKFFQNHGCNVLGIDPAKNAVEIALKKGIHTILDFFNDTTSKKIKNDYTKFDLITSHNTLAHVDNLVQTFKSIKSLMDSNSIFIFEVGYRLDIIQNYWFDTIYHEHLDYHAVSPLRKSLNNIGIKIFRVERGEQQGGSLRLYCSLLESKIKIENNVQKLVDIENKEGLYKLSTYKKYYEVLIRNRFKLKNIISEYKRQNKKVVGFGVPTKAATLMTFFEITEKDIDYFVDDNILKQNKYTPVGKIPIFKTETIYKDTPDLIVIFAWNFYESILSNHKELKNRGSKFLVPLPNPRIID